MTPGPMPTIKAGQEGGERDDISWNYLYYQEKQKPSPEIHLHNLKYVSLARKISDDHFQLKKKPGLKIFEEMVKGKEREWVFC